jgi:hypothetical protein
MNSAASQSSATEMFGQATRMFEAALKCGAKTQEEWARWFTGVLDGLGSPQQWQKRGEGVVNEVLATSRNSMDEMVRVMKENSETAMRLLQKAMEARGEPPDKDVQARSQQLWETTLGALRANMQAVIQSNARLLDSWAEVAKIMAGQSDKQDGQPA